MGTQPCNPFLSIRRWWGCEGLKVNRDWKLAKWMAHPAISSWNAAIVFSVKILTASGSALGLSRISRVCPLVTEDSSFWWSCPLPFHRPFFIPRSHPPVLSFHAPPPAYNPIPRKTLKVNPIDNPIDLQHLPRFALLKQIPLDSGRVPSKLVRLLLANYAAYVAQRVEPCTGSLPVAKQYECLLRFIGVDISFHFMGLRIKLLLLLLSLLFFGWK